MQRLGASCCRDVIVVEEVVALGFLCRRPRAADRHHLRRRAAQRLVESSKSCTFRGGARTRLSEEIRSDLLSPKHIRGTESVGILDAPRRGMSRPSAPKTPQVGQERGEGGTPTLTCHAGAAPFPSCSRTMACSAPTSSAITSHTSFPCACGAGETSQARSSRYVNSCLSYKAHPALSQKLHRGSTAASGSEPREGSGSSSCPPVRGEGRGVSD